MGRFEEDYTGNPGFNIENRRKADMLHVEIVLMAWSKPWETMFLFHAFKTQDLDSTCLDKAISINLGFRMASSIALIASQHFSFKPSFSGILLHLWISRDDSTIFNSSNIPRSSVLSFQLFWMSKSADLTRFFNIKPGGHFSPSFSGALGACAVCGAPGMWWLNCWGNKTKNIILPKRDLKKLEPELFTLFALFQDVLMTDGKSRIA